MMPTQAASHAFAKASQQHEQSVYIGDASYGLLITEHHFRISRKGRSVAPPAAPSNRHPPESQLGAKPGPAARPEPPV